MVTTLYVIRHCQSAGNADGRFQGRFDAPVNEAGEKQLALLALRFRNEHLDAIYSSPLQRAYRTAEAVNQFHGLPIHTDDALLETDMGRLQNALLTEIGRDYPQVAYNWDHAPDLCAFPGGETMAQVYARTEGAIRRIVEENPGKTVAVVTHGGVIRCLNALVEHGSLLGLRQSAVFGNTSVSTLLAEDGRLSWQRVNDRSHLPEELQKPPMQYKFHTEAL